MDDWIAPKPTEYAGIRFRSALEAWWASALDDYEIKWEYEQHRLTLPSGVTYLPDFWLPDLATVIEAKGAHMLGTEKTRELAKAAVSYAEGDPGKDIIVLFGWAPEWCTEPGQPQSLMRWGDAANYNALFTACRACGAQQWCRPRISLECRRCGSRFTGHLSGPHDEVPFGRSRDLKFSMPSVFGRLAPLNAMVPYRGQLPFPPEGHQGGE